MDCNYSEYSNLFTEFINSSVSKTVSILIHRNADGDCIGSSLSMCLFLKSLGYDCKIISTNCYNRNFEWMHGIENILVFDSLFKSTAISHLEKSDLIICVDFNQKGRVDSGIFDLISEKKICIIDHHLDQPDIEGLHLLNSCASSTCEVVYEILNQNYSDKITRDIAICLYSGIISDTGHFVTQNMTYRVYEIVGKLMKDFNLEVHIINKNLFGNNRFARMRFLGHVLSKCLKIVPNYKVAYISLTKEDTSRFYLKPGETDGLVNYALSIENIVVAALFNQKPDGVYISLRSIGDFSVGDLAKQYFNGGGHKNAAGGFCNCSVDEAINKFINLLLEYNSLKFNN